MIRDVIAGAGMMVFILAVFFLFFGMAGPDHENQMIQPIEEGD